MDKVAATIYLVIDSDGDWAAAGYHHKNELPPPPEGLALIRDWNLAEDLGFYKAYKITVEVPIPSISEVVELRGKLESLEAKDD